MAQRRLFFLCCFAMVTTSMLFAIRGDIADPLGWAFHLDKQQVGSVLGLAFLGFTLSIIVGGSLVDYLGMRNVMALSSVGYVAAIGLMVFAPRPAGVGILKAGMLLSGLAQGLVEGVANPLVATLFPDTKTKKLNRLHSWWPGGLIIGGLISYAITKAMHLDAPGITLAHSVLGWQVKLVVVLVPAVIFGLLLIGLKFPETERVASGVTSAEMFKEAFQPMFLLLFVCMWLTSSSELGPDQWVPSVMSKLAHMPGVLILVYTAGIMFIGRNVAGPLAKKFSPIGLLTFASFFTCLGLLALSSAHGMATAFLAATVFGVGKCYFWPTMLGVTSERFPKGGALLLAIMGGAGMLSTYVLLPIMGRWYDQLGPAATFRHVAVLPAILLVVFGAMYLYYKSRGGYRAIRLSEGDPAESTASAH